MVPNGSSCIDKYESSVWETTDSDLINSIKRGVVTQVDLVSLGGTPRGVVADDYGTPCPDTAKGCTTLYAVSIPNVTPSGNITWFQAAAACRNAGKRLPTNQEWQTAAFGTPDSNTGQAGDCNIAATAPANTGSRSLCVSDIGAYDMVGNMWEVVSDFTQGGRTDWFPNEASATFTSGAAYGNDAQILIEAPGAQAAADQHFSSVIYRGGAWDSGSFAGVFSTTLALSASAALNGYGFRCAK
jgi:formylglycine-generating enzyme required for sulfatase activity